MSTYELLLIAAACTATIFFNRFAVSLAKLILVAIIVWLVATEILHII